MRGLVEIVIGRADQAHQPLSAHLLADGLQWRDQHHIGRTRLAGLDDPFSGNERVREIGRVVVDRPHRVVARDLARDLRLVVVGEPSAGIDTRQFHEAIATRAAKRRRRPLGRLIDP